MRGASENKISSLLSIGSLFLAVFILSGCSSYSTETSEEDPAYKQDTVIEDFNLSEQGSQTFNGYECTDDCSGHEAGYNWAEEKGITDPSDCGGNSNSFIEGCQSYAEEQ